MGQSTTVVPSVRAPPDLCESRSTWMSTCLRYYSRTHRARCRCAHARADGTATLDDARLLDRAHELGRVMFSREEDFLAEATSRLRSGGTFAGRVFAHQLRVTIGRCTQDLELIAKCSEPGEFLNRTEHLLLK